MRAINNYQGSFIVKCALRLAPLLFVRPGELRKAEWAEFELDGPQPIWKIPASKMKAGKEHWVPLTAQVLQILKELQPLTGRSKFVFPSARTDTRPMSENAVLAALRRMGFGKDEMTGHGFRSMASTILHENGWASDVIELQLAHVSHRNSVRAAYDRSERLVERRRMMEWWSDHLDQLAATTTIMTLPSRADAEASSS
jgi:integrase